MRGARGGVWALREVASDPPVNEGGHRLASGACGTVRVSVRAEGSFISFIGDVGRAATVIEGAGDRALRECE